MMRVTDQVEALREAIARCRARLDADAVHDARVAARRLIAFLAIAELRVLRHDLRRLVRGLGRLRDLDVALEAPLGGAFRAWLAGERRREAARVRPLLAAGVEAVFTALTNLPAPSAKAQAQGLARARAGVGRRAREAKRVETIDAVHALRKALRRERYVREWLGLDVRALRDRQELVGVACDLASLRRLILEAGDERAAAVVQGGVDRLVPLLTR
ncbi:MAG: CHAD domain-containing protein [Myxococcaceae bacterium]|nr:CHAD domain-containing protein [Myxococcaceae bacterium]